MAIPLFSGDVKQTDRSANTTVSILGYLIIEEIYSEEGTLVYRAVRYADQFPIAIKQLTKALTKPLLYQRLHQQEGISLFSVSNLISLIAENFQPVLDEVFYVGS